MTEQQVKIWFQNRRTKWKKRENGGSEQEDKDVEKSVMENDCDYKSSVDSLKTDNLSSEPDCRNLRSPIQEGVFQFNISRNPHDSDSLL